MVLGDTYYTSNNNFSCIEQMLRYYDEIQKNIIAMGPISDNEIKNVGIMSGEWDDEAHTKMSVKKLVEKPSIDFAKQNLQIDGTCYGNFGMWIINHFVFEQIGENIENKITSKGEYEFVEAIAQIINDVEVKALKIDGTSYDIGNVESYKKTLISTITNMNDKDNLINDDLNNLELLKKIKDMLKEEELKKAIK